MGMTAEVIAIGPFSESVADHLQYPREQYIGTATGTIVVSKVIEAHTSESSVRLAGCLGASPWDFNTHPLDSTRADVEKLSAEFDGIENFVALRTAGFRF